MPKTYVNGEQLPYKLASSRRKQLRTIGMVFIGVVIVISVVLSNNISLQIGSAEIFILLLVLCIISGILDIYSRKKVKTIRLVDQDAGAEENIADLLAQLGDEFIVLHEIVSPYGNIDHILISQKSGIILLETKFHQGTVTTTDNEILVNGKVLEKDFTALALKNSYWLQEETERLLKVKLSITPVVVFSNALVKFNKPVNGVRVINQKFLLQTLRAGEAAPLNAIIIWENREKLASYLTGEASALFVFSILNKGPF